MRLILLFSLQALMLLLAWAIFPYYDGMIGLPGMVAVWTFLWQSVGFVAFLMILRDRIDA